MRRRKRVSLFVVLAVAILGLVGFLIYHSGYFGNSGSHRRLTFGANEDNLSLVTIPKDVQNAVNKAKTSGIPNQGIRVDGPEYNIPVLMYHYVEYIEDKGDTIRASLDTTPNTLESEIKTLKQLGYTFLKASDLANILDGSMPVPDKPILLTFDDGHRDFYTDAFPILKKYNVKATQFVITGFLNNADFMTDAQLKEISKSDLIEIGDHTINHLALAGLPLATVEKEVEDSKITLETKLGILITTFAYPYGSFDLQAIQSLKRAGFRTGFSTIPGNKLANANRFFIKRIRPGGATGEGLINLIQKEDQ
jgi:peptidoglycan/xylan/chitin deacetylase (PgdA/CDA1 family)